MSPELKQAHVKIDTLLNGDFQVYLLLSCCPCEGRISGIVDSPNAVATLDIRAFIDRFSHGRWKEKKKKKDWFNNQRKLKSILLFDDKEN